MSWRLQRRSHSPRAVRLDGLLWLQCTRVERDQGQQRSGSRRGSLTALHNFLAAWESDDMQGHAESAIPLHSARVPQSVANQGDDASHSLSQRDVELQLLRSALLAGVNWCLCSVYPSAVMRRLFGELSADNGHCWDNGPCLIFELKKTFKNAHTWTRY